MPAETTRPPEATTFARSYPGTKDQVHQVRADLAPVVRDCPLADDLILMASEIATNAIVHSQSGEPGGMFTVRAEVCPGDYAWVEVIDQGGVWTDPKPDDDHGRGLGIVAATAGDGNWRIDGDMASRAVWFRVDWPEES